MPGRWFPIVSQLKAYDRHQLRADLAAGLTVGVMLIPQGMAYALIAGVPPIYGLYASLAPLLVYALLGTSRHLAVGPVALVSLLVAAAVAPLADADPQRYVALTWLLAAMVGILQMAMGVLRFGFLANFLSRPVLAGFTSAAALIIGASQLGHLLGIDLPRTAEIHQILRGVADQVGDVHGLTVLVGVGGMVILVVLRRVKPTFPAPLVVVGLSTLLVWMLGLHGLNLRIVGAVPGGLPAPVTPALLDVRAMWELLPVALAIALVGFMESLAVAKVYAARQGYDVCANRELMGLGAANLIGACFQAFPVTGGFSRTAVNAQAGARTVLAGVFSAVIIGLTLVFLTDLFHYLPNAALAAIVLVAVASLLDWREARYLWRTDRRDFAMLLITFAATLALGIETGILVGVLVSLTALVYASSRPHAAVCGRIPGTRIFRNIERHPEAEILPEVTVFRIDATLSFVNAEFVRDRVRELVEGGPPPYGLVLDFHAVNGVDSTMLHELDRIIQFLRDKGIDPHFAGVKGPVMDRFRRAGLDQRIGRDCFHMDVATAVEVAQSRASERPAGRPE